MGVVESIFRHYVAMAELLDAAPDVLFCVKAVDGRYVAVNRAFVERTGRRSRAEVIGRTVQQLFPPDLAQRYSAQDDRVMATQGAMVDQLELIAAHDGHEGWYVTTKTLVIGDAGAIVGLAVLSVDLETRGGDRYDAEALASVVEYVHDRLNEQITVAELAGVAGLSPLQLERRMRKIFGVTPKQYLVKSRVERARQLMGESRLSLSEIADACGWYDQSAFNRHFVRAVGVSPGAYRESLRAQAAER